jgi:hypothetical protein
MFSYFLFRSDMCQQCPRALSHGENDYKLASEAVECKLLPKIGRSRRTILVLFLETCVKLPRLEYLLAAVSEVNGDSDTSM